MSQRVEQVSQWVYEGLWGVLTLWFRVPAQPPTLPALAGEAIQSFRPAQGFLRYLKFQFWIALIVIDTLLVIGWLALGVASPLTGVLITPLALFLIIAPDVVAYLAIHLRFDTTWYVLSDRSLRIRRGIWIIHETTITFENVQNVTINQGPLQRWFGIADVVVETAGGSGGRGEQHAGMAAGHQGLVEGLDHAPQIRDLILSRLRRSRSAGLGDDHAPSLPSAGPLWSPAHLACLREIRDAVRGIAPR
jgi:membrane protein YdbS with pleckstrin-like domain